MVNYFLLSLSFLASISSFTIPQTLEEDVYIVPTYSESNELSLTVLPEVKLQPAPQKIDSDWGPSLASGSALIMDEHSGQILWQKNSEAVMPIASITKLMTALVALDYITDWEELHAMTPAENALVGASFPAGNGDEFTKEDILKTALIASANNAALALAHSTGLSDEEFVDAMNAKAEQLGMKNTSYVEPTGLEQGNMSTARDLAVLTRTVMNFDAIREPLMQAEHKMERKNEGAQPLEITVKTTNRLVKNADSRVIAGKTGFTYEAGYCLTTLATDEDGNELIIVVLNGPDATSRFEESQTLFNWTYDHYKWSKT